MALFTAVQSKTVRNVSTSAASITLDAAPTQGNLLVASLLLTAARTTTLSDTWQQVANFVQDGAGGNAAQFYKIVGSGESATQTICTWSDGDLNQVIVIEEYAADLGWPASPLEAHAENTDADATKTTTGTCNPTDYVHRLLVGLGASDGNRTFSAEKFNGSTTGVSERGDIGGGTTNGGESVCLFDKFDHETVSGNYTAEAVASATDDGSVGIAVFKPNETETAQITENFTDTAGVLLQAHHGDSGVFWTRHAAVNPTEPAPVISNANRLRVTGAGTVNAAYVSYASQLPAGADYDVEADFYIASQASRAGIIGRLSTSAYDGYCVQYVSSLAGWRLFRADAGTETILGTWTNTETPGTTHTVKLSFRGSTIKVYVDGVERISVTDSTHSAAGCIGIRLHQGVGSDTTGIHIDRITSTNFVAAPPIPLHRPLRIWRQ